MAETCTHADIEAIGNNRVRRLLTIAVNGGYPVEASLHTEGCWTIRRPDGSGRSLVVYAEDRHACAVMLADDPHSGSGFDPITQGRAGLLLADGAL